MGKIKNSVDNINGTYLKTLITGQIRKTITPRKYKKEQKK